MNEKKCYYNFIFDTYKWLIIDERLFSSTHLWTSQAIKENKFRTICLNTQRSLHFPIFLMFRYINFLYCSHFHFLRRVKKTYLFQQHPQWSTYVSLVLFFCFCLDTNFPDGKCETSASPSPIAPYLCSVKYSKCSRMRHVTQFSNKLT